MPSLDRLPPTSRRSFLATAITVVAGCSTGPADSRNGAPTGTATSTAPGTGTPTTQEPTPDESTGDRPAFVHWAYEAPHVELGTVSLAPGASGPAVYVTSDSAVPGDDETDHAISAISLPDGTEQWRLSLPNRAGPVPLYGGDGGPPRIYVATSEVSLHGEAARLHAIDPTRGEEAWRFDADERGFLNPLAATNDAVFVGTADDVREGRGETVYALAAGDSAERWRADSGDADASGSIERRGTLVVDDPDGLRAFDPTTGDPRWDYRPDRRVEGPVYDNRGERAFLGHDGTVLALGLADGEERWRREFDFQVTTVTSPRAALSDAVFVASYGGDLLALSPLDGTTRWTRAVDVEGYSPTVQRTSETLFVDGSPGVLALDPVSGETRWSFAPDVEGPLRAHASTTVFANGGHDERVWALDPSTGETRWAFAPDSEIVGPVTAGDFAFLGVDGTVLAMDGSAPA